MKIISYFLLLIFININPIFFLENKIVQWTEFENSLILKNIITRLESEKIFLFNYDHKYFTTTNEYLLQKNMIENNLKKQVIAIFNKIPFFEIGDSSGIQYFFFDEKSFAIEFSWKEISQDNKLLLIRLFYKNTKQITTIVFSEQISNETIIDALINKVDLEENEQWVFYFPIIVNSNVWHQKIIAKIKDISKDGISINFLTYSINYYDLAINILDISKIKNNQLSLVINYKQAQKYINIKTKYLLTGGEVISFIKEKISNFKTEIQLFDNVFDDSAKKELINELIQFIGLEFTNSKGFNVHLDLIKHLDIIFTPNSSLIMATDYEIGVKYQNNYLPNIKVSFQPKLKEAFF